MSPIRMLASTAAVALAAASTLVVPTAEAARPVPTRSIAVGSNPYDIAIAQNLGQALVVNDGSVSVVSLLTRREIAEVGTGGFHGQNAIALVRGETQAYITNFNTSTMVDWDTETRRVIRQIPVGAGAVDVATANTPKGQRAYVALLNSNQIVGVSTSTGTVVQRIKVPGNPQTVTTAPGGKSVWVGSANAGVVWVISTITGKITRTIDVDAAGPVSSIAFQPRSHRVWVAGLAGVSVVSTRTYRTVKFLPILKIFPNSSGANMGPIAFNGSGSRVLVTNSTFPDTPSRGSVSVISTKNYRLLSQIRTGIEPTGLAVDTKRDTAYVTNYSDDTVTYFTQR